MEASGFLRGLDEMERQCNGQQQSQRVLLIYTVFRAAHDSSRAVKAWLGESTKKKA